MAPTEKIRAEIKSEYQFFKAMGFRATGLVRDAFPDVGEDGIAMELRVGAAVRIAG